MRHIGFLFLFLFQYSLTMEPEKRVFSSPDIVGCIIRCAIAGQAFSYDLTTKGHYVCTDFVKYKNDQNCLMIPWITKLFYINKLFYITTKTILQNYHDKPNQISELVDYFCLYFQDSINAKIQEELPISTYFSKYFLNKNCVDYTTIFYKALFTVTAFKTCKSLEKYQKDFSSFLKQYEKYIDFDACSIKSSNNKLERRYFMDQQFLCHYIYLPEDIVEYYLTKVKEHVSGQESNLPCVSLTGCIWVHDPHVPVIEHLPKKCEKIISFLNKIFSCSELSNLQKSIHDDVAHNITNVLICDNVKSFMQKEHRMNAPVENIIDLFIDIQKCPTRNKHCAWIDPKKIDEYEKGEIFFEEVTLNVIF